MFWEKKKQFNFFIIISQVYGKLDLVSALWSVEIIEHKEVVIFKIALPSEKLQTNNEIRKVCCLTMRCLKYQHQTWKEAVVIINDDLIINILLQQCLSSCMTWIFYVKSHIWLSRKEEGIFLKIIQCAHLENTSGDMRISSDLSLIYMVYRNSMTIM